MRLDKQVDTKNENLKKNSGVHASPRKVCNENKRKKVEEKNDCCVKFFY